MITAGERLRQTRLEQGMTLEQAEKATRIKKAFLGAIERNDYNALPSPMYAQGFVRNYAHLLDIPNSEIMPLFKRQYDEVKAYDVLPKGFTKEQRVPTRHMRVRRTVVGFGLILLVFVIYLVIQFRSLFLPPTLHVTSPQESASVSQDVTVAGHADSEATVYVNGALIELDQNGNFTKQLTLFPGRETVTIIARNRFGKETKIDRSVSVKPRT